MASEMAVVLRYIRRFARLEDRVEQSDGHLLQKFVAEHDECAFVALLERHGALVFGVCRQVLGDLHDAEDAFQATFLVLARKAGSVCKQESLAAWLYRVALNVSRTAKVNMARRRGHEMRALPIRETHSKDEVALRDWQLLIHEEADQLPEKYRVPIVLCYLEGKTHDEAARHLSWPLGKGVRTLFFRLFGSSSWPERACRPPA